MNNNVKEYNVINNVFYLPNSSQIKVYKELNNFNLVSNNPSGVKVNSFKGENSFSTNGGIYLTNRCPLRCRYCSFGTGNDGTTLSIGQIDTFLKLIIRNAMLRKTILKEKQVKCFLQITGGGEPTSFPEKLEYCVRKFKENCRNNNFIGYISITTNLVCDIYRMKDIFKEIDRITVSYDGNCYAQNLNRPLKNNGNSSDIVEKNIIFLDSNKFPYGIRSTIDTEDNNLDLIDIYRNIAQKYKNCSFWQVEPVYKLGRGVEYNTSNLGFVKKYIKLLEYTNNIHASIEIINSDYCFLTKEVECESITGRGLWMDAHGMLFNCPTQENYNEQAIGYVTDLEVVFKNRKNNYDSFVNDVYQNCSNCYAFEHCKGGCPVIMKRDKSGNLSEEAQDICGSIKYFWMTFLTNLFNKKEYLGYRIIKNELSDNNFDLFDIKKI